MTMNKIKSFAPAHLSGSDLPGLLQQLGHATPAQAARLLQVSERTVWRWISDSSAPWSALAALWHETPTGRAAALADAGNELAIIRGLTGALQAENKSLRSRLVRLMAISDTGAANDAFMDVPAAPQGQIRLQIVNELDGGGTITSAPGLSAMWAM